MRVKGNNNTMTLTEQEIAKLVRAKGNTTPATLQDAIQEALIAAWKAEEEKPGDKDHAIGRAISAARNLTRGERNYQKRFGGGEFAQGLCIHDENAANVLVMPVDDNITEKQLRAFNGFLARQDKDTRSVITRYLDGANMNQISHQTLISHSQVSRIIRRFREAAARVIGGTE